MRTLDDRAVPRLGGGHFDTHLREFDLTTYSTLGTPIPTNSFSLLSALLTV